MDLTGGQLYEIVLRRDTTTHLAVRDPFLKGVYDDRGRLLHTDGTVYPFPHFGATGGTADSNSGPGNTALTYFDAPYGGTYYIGVTSAGGREPSRPLHPQACAPTGTYYALANDDCASRHALRGPSPPTPNSSSGTPTVNASASHPPRTTTTTPLFLLPGTLHSSVRSDSGRPSPAT